MEGEIEERSDPNVVRTDVLIDRVNALTDTIDKLIRHESSTTTQTVIHKSSGVGPWAAAAICACFFTFLGLILFALVVIPEMHDLKAWSDIYRSKIYTLEKK